MMCDLNPFLLRKYSKEGISKRCRRCVERQLIFLNNTNKFFCRSRFIFLFNLYSFMFMLCFFSILSPSAKCWLWKTHVVICRITVLKRALIWMISYSAFPFVCVCAVFFLFSVLPVMISFCGNLILKIAPLSNGPLLSQVVQAAAAAAATLDAWLIHCSLSSHSHFILPRLPLLGYLMEMVVWGAGWLATIKPVDLRCDWLVGFI